MADSTAASSITSASALDRPITSTAVVMAEIERFLQSPDPEVLCIAGAWGVGKTFAWKRYLDAAEKRATLAAKRYAYVSLFGVNSLTELRNSITENTVAAEQQIDDPSISSLRAILRHGERYIRKSRPLIDIAAGVFRMKDAGDALYRAAFLAVSEQLICFDDLERAGKGLEMRDVLGLASMLREQRRCKIVLLLNREQVAEADRAELDRQLEKVVDSFLVFAPTSAEATAIAMTGEDPLTGYLRDRIIALEMTNIRVIKKIERWAGQLRELLHDRPEWLLKQALATVTLAGWALLQPGVAPSLGFIRQQNGLGVDPNAEDLTEQVWRGKLANYGYRLTDALDQIILSGVEAGYFQRDLLIEAAASIEAQRNAQGMDDSFTKAWELYHRSLTTDDAVILEAMHHGALDTLETTSLPNMNGAIKLLRRHGREAQASEVVARYVAAHADNPGFFSRSNRTLIDDGIDPELLEALEAGRAAQYDRRDPVEVLRKAAETSGFNPPEDVALLLQLSANDFITLFDANAANNVKGMMRWARIIGDHDQSGVLAARLDVVFNSIAARSPMRMERLRSWGVLRDQQPTALASGTSRP